MANSGMASIGPLRWACAGAGLPTPNGPAGGNALQDVVRPLFGLVHGVLRIDEQALPTGCARPFGWIGCRGGERRSGDDGGGCGSNRGFLLQLEAIHAAGEIDLEARPPRHVLAARNRDVVFFFSSRRRHTRCLSDWSSDVCSSD